MLLYWSCVPRAPGGHQGMRDFVGCLLSLKPFHIPGMVPLTPLGKSRRLAQGRRLKFCLRLGFWSSPRSPIRSSSLRRVLPRVPSARALVCVSGASLVFAQAFYLCFGARLAHFSAVTCLCDSCLWRVLPHVRAFVCMCCAATMVLCWRSCLWEWFTS